MHHFLLFILHLTEQFHCHENSIFHLVTLFSLLLNSWPTTDINILLVLTFQECHGNHIVGITENTAFSNWPLSLHNMHLRTLHVILWLGCLMQDKIPLSGCTTVYVAFWRTSGCIQQLENMNKAAINFCAQVFVWI